MFSDPQTLAPDMYLLQGYVNTAELLPHVLAITAQVPFRHMTIPGGGVTKAALSNAGALGWNSTRFEYRYSAVDPDTGRSWPAIPAMFSALATRAAATCGFADFVPDACLLNRYVAGAGMGLHQDKNERDFTQPIVSVSIGASCRFIIGGLARNSPTRSIVLQDGDVMVWGGASRLVYHGVRPLGLDSDVRYNLTLRRAA